MERKDFYGLFLIVDQSVNLSWTFSPSHACLYIGQISDSVLSAAKCSWLSL